MSPSPALRDRIGIITMTIIAVKGRHSARMSHTSLIDDWKL